MDEGRTLERMAERMKKEGRKKEIKN